MKNSENITDAGIEAKKEPEKVFTGYLKFADPGETNGLEPRYTDENVIILHVPLDKLQFMEIMRLTEGRKNGMRLILTELSELDNESHEEDTNCGGPNKVKIDYNISKRKKEVLECLAEGMSYEEISEFLNVSINTVKRHVSDLFPILDVHNRTLATRKYLTFIKTVFIIWISDLITGFSLTA